MDDAIGSGPALARWLASVGHPIGDGVVSDQVVEQFRATRDALRRLAWEATGDDRPAATPSVTDVDSAIGVLNAACALAPSWSQLEQVGQWPPQRALYSHHKAEEVRLSLIAEEGVRLFSGEGLAELMACRAPGCVQYYLRQHPRQAWCSSGCGNRARVARHYERHHRQAG